MPLGNQVDVSAKALGIDSAVSAAVEIDGCGTCSVAQQESGDASAIVRNVRPLKRGDGFLKGRSPNSFRIFKVVGGE